MKNRVDIYQTVTDTIIAAIENGLSGKFEMPWRRVNRMPENARTGNCYQGINVPLLWVYQFSGINFFLRVDAVNV